MTSSTGVETTVSLADPAIGDRELGAVQEALQSGQLAAGEQVRAFESEFATLCETDHAVATSNGTTALHAALVGLGVEPGDTVLTTPFTFVATANAIRLAGATPIFADVDPETFNLDPRAVADAIEDRDGDVDAIIAVHLYGLPAPMGHLREVADRYDVPIVEDAAQAHGARTRDGPVGGLGDVGCFSFYPTKNMTTGEGGMITTDRENVAERAARFVDHGRVEGYEHDRVGHNFRLTDVAAALGRVQLERLPEFVANRRRNARRLTETLEDTSIRQPVEPDHATHAYNQYTVRCERRDAFAEHLEGFGIDSKIYYPTPVHEQSAYEGHGSTYPVAERLATEVLSLPVHPELSNDDLDAIETALRYFDEYA